MPKLYLVRHAEPELTGVLLGRCDPGLSGAGKRQGSSIALPDVAVIYTSELRRARDTAAAIATAPVVIDPDLNEISYGEWDGRTWSDIEHAYPEQAKAKLSRWTAVTPPGGEGWKQFELRVSRALVRIMAGAFPAAVVAHVTVNAQIAYSVSGSDPSQFIQDYGEVLTYVF
jgi:broad specificity phosphatase PhoE